MFGKDEEEEEEENQEEEEEEEKKKPQKARPKRRQKEIDENRKEHTLGQTSKIHIQRQQRVEEDRANDTDKKTDTVTQGGDRNSDTEMKTDKHRNEDRQRH